MSQIESKKLKILFIIPYFLPAWHFGGVVRETYDIAVRLSSRGHKVSVLTTNINKLNEVIIDKEKQVDGLDIHYFPNLSNYLAFKFKLIYPLKMKSYLKDIVSNYDIVHVHDIYTIMTLWAYKIAKKHQKPFFLSPMGELAEYPQKNKRILKFLLNWLLRKPFEGATNVIGQTEDEICAFNTFKLKNSALINCGINLAEFEKLPARDISRKRYKILDNEFLILFVGRINEIKGLKYLIEALSILNDPKVKLLVIGPSDNYFDQLHTDIKKYYLEQQVIIPTWVSDQEKIEAYRGADIFCLPSIYDCAPMTILEACACELPIITTSTNGLNGIAIRGAGLVVPPRNGQELMKAIKKMMENQSDLPKMGKIGKSIVFSEFNWTQIIEKLEKLYYSNIA